MTTDTYTPDATDIAVAGMLVENSGSNIVDSGMADRRAWQRNQKKVGDMTPAEFFRAQPVAHWFSVGTSTAYGDSQWVGGKWRRKAGAPLEVEMIPLVSVFHFLTDVLSLDETADAWFQKWGADRDGSWLGLQDEFHEAYAAHLAREAWYEPDGADVAYRCEEDGFTPEQVGKMTDQDIVDHCPHYEAPSGIYGDGGAFTEYTYNYENAVDHDYQFAYGTIDSVTYVVVSVHTGMDARWGFSTPRVFTASDYDGTDVLDAGRRVYAYCDNRECGMSWSSDDAGSNWYGDDDKSIDIGDYKVREGDAITAFVYSQQHPIGQAIAANRAEMHEDTMNDPDATWQERRVAERAVKSVGEIVVEQTPGYAPDIAYCPGCGVGHITPSWFGNG